MKNFKPTGITSNHIKKKSQWHQKKLQTARKRRPAPYVMHDKYFQQAKKEGYRARSIYKLKEIQEQFELVTENMDICDIWAAPGSFIQYMKKIIKDTGNIVGIDLKPIEKYSQNNINTLVHDIFEFHTLKPRVEEIIGVGKQFDLITSDIAPNTTGRKDIDQYASVELNLEVLKFADIFLKTGGNLLLKIFKGEDFRDLTTQIQNRYTSFTEYKPYACRDRSFEEYIICFWKK